MEFKIDANERCYACVTPKGRYTVGEGAGGMWVVMGPNGLWQKVETLDEAFDVARMNEVDA